MRYWLSFWRHFWNILKVKRSESEFKNTTQMSIRRRGGKGGCSFCNKCPSLHFYALQPLWHTSNEYIILFFGKIEYFTKRHLYNSKDDNWLTSESCNKAWISKSIIKILWWKRRNIFWGIAQYKKQKRNNAKKAITF